VSNEISLTVNEAVANCAKKIRQTAGAYQSDGNLIAAKLNVDLALTELAKLNSKKPALQVINWGQLLFTLKSHYTPCSDIRWMTVIKYARTKASARRADIVYKLKI